MSENLRIETTAEADLSVVSLAGEIDLRSSPGMRESLREYTHERSGKFVFDLSEVTYIDSSGVGTLVELKRSIDRRKGQLVLVGLQPRVRSVMEMTRLDQFFDIRATVNEARAP